MKVDKYQNLEQGCFYHVYNRGINGGHIFFEHRNYEYFLKQYAHYLHGCAETYAYCLLKNHFHLLIRVREVSPELKGSHLGIGLHAENAKVSKQFSDFFNSYTRAINRSQNRTGSLLERRFKRIKVTSDVYVTRLLWYIHFNPQKHGVVSDFRTYGYSSYNALLSDKATKLERERVNEWFGSRKAFQSFHNEMLSEASFAEFKLED